MTDRQLMQTISDQIGTMNKRMDSMSDQIGQLVHHVAEVRRSNVRLEAEIRALDSKVDKNTDLLASKIDHFINHFSIEQARDRTRSEEERHLRIYTQEKFEQRLDALEQRVDHMETALS